jgi:folate-dependent phosphoribosylglycinamide formyltransferase PurN
VGIARVTLQLALLTLDGAEHRYVARAVLAAFPEGRVAVVQCTAQQPLGRRVARLTRRYGPRQLSSRLLARLYQGLSGYAVRRERGLRQVLFDGGPAPAIPAHAVYQTPTHNGDACRALLRRMQPDVIAVYGTDVIRPPVLALAGRGAVNLHTGMSPRYRGADSVFWALHNGEPDRVGVTVHLLDAGVDAGPVLYTARPAIAPDDDEHTLFAKCVLVGAPLYVRAIRDVAAGVARGQPQALADGREYRFLDRTIAAERRVQRLVRDGLIARHATDR